MFYSLTGERAVSDEIEVWRWQYTNEFGKRAVSSGQMSADESAKYKDAVPVPGTREIRGISRVDERLQPLAKHVREGRFFESPWQLVRFGNLQGVSDEEAVQTLAAWCKRQSFEMSFVMRQVGSVHVVCLVLKVKPPAR
jgi:hypothetical protein